ncbi:IS30 family transposase, partial [Parachlamydia acanthamoebae]
MSAYKHLSKKERCRIRAHLDTGKSISQIAKILGRHRSTLYRELARNSYTKKYLPDTAQKKYTMRRDRKKKSKIKSCNKLFHYIAQKLKSGWSPEQISGRMRLENKEYYVCHETIYRYIYACKQGKPWYSYLCKAKPYRGKRMGRKVGSGKYQGIKLISDRPAEIKTRVQFGHWEGDTIAFSANQYTNITTLVERKTRFSVFILNSAKKSEEVINKIKHVMEGLSASSWKTITFDQGSEFAYYRLIERHNKKCKVYFCHPRSPWEKGTNENMNGRVRRFLPRNYDVKELNQSAVADLAKKLNNIPRKILNYLTPREALQKHTQYALSHFRLERA